MLMRQSDELNIQKCVDHELSAKDTSDLLRRLDSITDGWKTLACGLLEDRRIRSILTKEQNAATSRARSQPIPARVSYESSVRTEHSTAINDSDPSLSPKGKNQPRVSKLNHVVRSWWSHPVTSLTLCAAIAFVSGLLIPDFRSTKSAGNNSLSQTNSTVRSALAPAAANAEQQYRVELQPGGRSVEIPVVTDLSKLYELDRRHPIFRGSKGKSENVQWMVLPVEGNKSMLIPVSEDSSSDMQ
jgi:hypothetical protein